MEEEVKKQWNPPWWSLVVSMWVFVAAIATGGALMDGRGLLFYAWIVAAVAPFCAIGVHLATVVVKYLLRVLLDWAIYEAHTVFNLLHPVEQWLKWRCLVGAGDKYRLWFTALVSTWLAVLLTANVLPEHVMCDNWYGPLLLCFSGLFLLGPWTVRAVPPEELAALDRDSAPLSN